MLLFFGQSECSIYAGVEIKLHTLFPLLKERGHDGRVRDLSFTQQSTLALNQLKSNLFMSISVCIKHFANPHIL